MRLRASSWGTFLGCGLLIGCGGSAQVAPAPQTPSAEGPAQTERVATYDAFALPTEHEVDRIPDEPKGIPDLDTWKRLKNPKGLPARPAQCKLAKPVKPAGTCLDEATALTQLDSALAKSGADRDAALAGLESCKLPPGFVTALRAELSEPQCADAITDPWLDKPSPEAKPGLVHVLVGQSLGAKLARTVLGQPTLSPPFSKAQTEAFLKTKLAPWAVAQAQLVQEISAAGGQLAGLGQAILATEAGRADLRFVEVARQVPTAPEFSKDPELKQIYESALEQALEPRKARGRDATLIGLRTFADFGVIAGSKRMQSARILLASMYGGRRVDGLDALIVPAPLGAADKDLVGDSPQHTIPSFLWREVPSLAAAAAHEADTARNAMVLSPEQRRSSPPQQDPAERAGRARTSLRLAATHFRRASADAAIDLTAALPRSEAVEFLLALGLALHHGPKDVVTMMASSAPGSLGYRKLDALEAVAKKNGSFAAAATFDAALLREIAPPEGADRAYFDDLAARYRAAERLFGTAPEAKLAGERAKHAEEIARAAASSTP